MEGLLHADKCFVTLTYAEDRRDLVPRDFQLWLKRLRKRVSGFPGADGEPRKLRFYGVGEYGDHTCRPHYHSALFGWPACSGQGPKIGGVCQCLACSVVRETWGFGHVLVGRLEEKSAQYIAGYVTKKMTHRDDLRLRGREPEFARMSLNPGIGADAMWAVASEMIKYNRKKAPMVLEFGKSKKLPLGRYLRGKLKSYADCGDEDKKEYLQIAANQMQIVRAFAWSNSRSVASVFHEANEPYARQIEARDKLRELKREAKQVFSVSL